MNLNILHCVLDEKFVDPMIDLTQQLWTDCIHNYVFVTENTSELRFITKSDFVTRIRPVDFVKIFKKTDYDVVVLHCFYSLRYNLITKIPSNIKVIWFAWGYDIYMPNYCHPALINIELYHERTKEVLKGLKDKSFRTIVAEVYYRLFYKKAVEHAINRVDFFSGVIPEEYDMIKKNQKNKFFKAKQLIFNYNNPLYPYKKECINDSVVEGFDIQIGNSADSSNNHIDVFEKLSKYKLNDRKIIVPLSYAGTQRYKQMVISEGEKCFGDIFIPLTDYMPLQQYEKIISTSNYSIFCLERQQAMGNIWFSLWRGCMVFLSETNPVYSHLINRGYKVFSIQNDLIMIEQKARLAHKEVIRNRELLIEEHSYDAEQKKAEVILRELRNSVML